MNTLHLERIDSQPKSCFRLGAFLGALCLGATAWAQSGTPVGNTWDCLLSGKRNGVAYLTFSATNNGTVTGYEILVPQPLTSPHAVLVNDALGSNGLGVEPPAPTETTNIYGAFPINGSWSFDSKGRIIGFYFEVAGDASCTTNVVPISTNNYPSTDPTPRTNFNGDTFCVILPIWTNTPPDTYTNQEICYSNQVACGYAVTNTVNFTGKAVTGKRLTLTCKTSLGTVTMRGVPAVELMDLSGSWYGVKKQSGTTSYEFFTLTNLVGFPNTYLADGSGATYTYQGVAALSSQKKIALAFSITNVNGSYQSTRAVVGSFNSRKVSGNTSGLDAPGGTTGLTNRCTFQVTKRSSVP
jgi:hypothetical protein